MPTSKKAKAAAATSERASRRCEAPDCDVDFVPNRSTARYHSTTCRSRAARSRKAAEDNATEAAKTDTPAEHELVKVVRLELVKVDALLTVHGQLALQVARRIANPDASGISALSKELRELLAEAGAIQSKPPAGDDEDPKPDEPEDDEVTRARTRRKEAREAAGLA